MKQFTVEKGISTEIDFLNSIQEYNSSKYIVKNNKGIEYYNIPAGFDIETTSFYEYGEKRSLMYLWNLGVFNKVINGRTWEELFVLLDCIRQVMDLSESKILVIYVYNLPYEFQFIRKRCCWDKVFQIEERKVVYAQTNGIEYRCGLKLSGGKSLKKVGDDLLKYKVQKLNGFLDYKIIRSPLTPLTQKEIDYGESDVRVILSYIQEKIEQDGDITRIPLTNTGYVREFCRKSCYGKNWLKYRNLINNLTLEPDEYSQLKRAFQGGFVHANAHHANKILKNLRSKDFISSYPAWMVLELFPMSRGIRVNENLNTKMLKHYMDNYCCLFDIEMKGLMATRFNENPISSSKCFELEAPYFVNNGRIVGASRVKMTITELDFITYSKFYTWDSIKISNLIIYEKGYLPVALIEAILYFYEGKTTLKDVVEEIVNYMISKNMLNACYGMIVTDIVREVLEYINNEFITKEGDVDEQIKKYNENKKRFLFYPWGVWVTAYARFHLFEAIYELEDDYVYGDTDCVKYKGGSKYDSWFEGFNNKIIDAIKRSSEYTKIPIEKYMAKDKYGVLRVIGTWDSDGEYLKFKTLGAKRYIYTAINKKGEEELHVTIAGSNKSKTAEYLSTFAQPFKEFKDELVVPKEYSGRNVLTYIDEETEGILVDCNGVPYHYHELSSVHMEESEYSLSLSDDYVKWLKQYEEWREE